MNRTPLQFALFTIAFVALSSFNVFANDSNDRVQIGRDIRVGEGQPVGDLVCVGCSIYVRGAQTSGDAVAVGGSINLEGASIGGDTVAVAGSVRLRGESQVAGNAVAVMGSVTRDQDAIVRGDITSLGGPGWFLLIGVLPLVVFAGIIALIVWLIQRVRTPQPAAQYQAGAPSPRS
jgi:hypothetical protein